MFRKFLLSAVAVVACAWSTSASAHYYGGWGHHHHHYHGYSYNNGYYPYGYYPVQPQAYAVPAGYEGYPAASIINYGGVLYRIVGDGTMVVVN